MEELFKQVQLIVQQAHQVEEESRKRGELFNIFEACGVNHYENTHSAIIAELLNPNGSHGQADSFLTLFLCSYKSDICFSLENGASVATEVVTEEGRIDILITNPEGQAIIIENKIYAHDQWEQLKRYDKYAEEKYGKGNYEILYLTLFGDKASMQSAEGVKYISISYAIHIVEWLEECINYSVRLPLIRETLIQYQNLIKQLTNQDMETKEQEELFCAMAKHAEETEAIVNAGNNGYLQFVWDKYVKPTFDSFVAKEENKLQYVGDSYKCFYFCRPEWKKTAIKICFETGRHYIGISSTLDASLEDLSQLPKRKLSCFTGEPTDWWPYGWQWLEPYDKWKTGSGTIPAMIDGRFSKFILKRVTEIMEEIEKEKYIMI